MNTGLIDHHRERLINIVLFFAHQVPNLTRTQLALLIASLDFEHWLETARGVTGQDVTVLSPTYAEKLSRELDYPQHDLAEAINLHEGIVKPCREFDDSHITKRELRIMTNLV